MDQSESIVVFPEPDEPRGYAYGEICKKMGRFDVAWTKEADTMKKRILHLFSIVFLVVSSLSAQQPENLLENSSFEEIGPTGWKQIKWGKNDAAFITGAQGRAGGSSIGIAAETGGNAAWTTRVKVTPKTDYRLSGWIKTEDVHKSTGRGAQITLDINPEKSQAFLGTTDWTFVDYTFNSGKKKEIRIYALLGGNGTSSGKVWFDDLQLVSLAPAPENRDMVLDSIRTSQKIEPVLIGKRNNPVVQIRVHVSGGLNPLFLQHLTISTGGTTDLKDIKALRVFYTGTDDAFSTGQRFGTTQSAAPIVKFGGSVRLKSGTNYFWVSSEISPQASLSHRINATCESVTIDGLDTITPPRHHGAAGKRIGIALRSRGDDGINAWRIPGLNTTNKGTLIAVYDVRRNSAVDLQEDVDIGMSRSVDGGESWEPMKIIMDAGEWGGLPQKENGIGDPSVLVDRVTGTIWVAALWAHGHPGMRTWHGSRPGMKPAETGQMLMVKSDDDGRTWSEPINVTEQFKKPEWQLVLVGPGRGITMRNGTLVLPAQFKTKDKVPFATIMHSTDRGKTWSIGVGAKSNTTENQVVELRDGSLMLNIRDDRRGSRSVYVTSDLGASWQVHPTSRKALPEPVCMASILSHKIPDGRNVFIFSNPATTSGRYNMTLKLSLDDGASWPAEYDLLYNENSCYGYSCLTSIDENTVGVLYEGIGELYFQKFSVAELLKK